MGVSFGVSEAPLFSFGMAATIRGQFPGGKVRLAVPLAVLPNFSEIRRANRKEALRLREGPLSKPFFLESQALLERYSE